MALFRCPHCLFEKDVSNSFIGKKVKCPRCETKVIFQAQASEDRHTLATIATPLPRSSSEDTGIEPEYHPNLPHVSMDAQPGARSREEWGKPYADSSPSNRSSIASGPSTVLRAERQGLHEFLNHTREQDRGQGRFELENDRILELNLEGDGVWIQTGSMIAYRGEIRFRREGILEFGVKRLLKRALSAESATLTRAEGRGKLYVADQAKKISILELRGEGITVNGSDLLAFDDSIEWDVTFLKSMGAWLSGGFFNFKLKGQGAVAIATHFDPLTLSIGPEGVSTDPQATVAWSETLQPELKTDIQFKTLLGRGSGESLQMRFKGNGFVVVQPFETSPFMKGDPSAGGQRPGGGAGRFILAVIGILFFLGLGLLKR